MQTTVDTLPHVASASMKRCFHIWLSSLTVAYLVMFAASCSSSGPEVSATTSSKPATTTAFPGAHLDPTRIPTPHEMRQRIGLGALWQMTATTKSLSGTTMTVSVELTNGATVAASVPPFLKELYTLRDGIFGTDLPASAARSSLTTIPPGAATRITLTYPDFLNKKKAPVLLFRGARLDGSIDASVWLRGA